MPVVEKLFETSPSLPQKRQTLATERLSVPKSKAVECIRTASRTGKDTPMGSWPSTSHSPAAEPFRLPVTSTRMSAEARSKTDNLPSSRKKPSKRAAAAGPPVVHMAPPGSSGGGEGEASKYEPEVAIARAAAYYHQLWNGAEPQISLGDKVPSSSPSTGPAPELMPYTFSLGGVDDFFLMPDEPRTATAPQFGTTAHAMLERAHSSPGVVNPSFFRKAAFRLPVGSGYPLSASNKPSSHGTLKAAKEPQRPKTDGHGATHKPPRGRLTGAKPRPVSGVAELTSFSQQTPSTTSVASSTSSPSSRPYVYRPHNHKREEQVLQFYKNQREVSEVQVEMDEAVPAECSMGGSTHSMQHLLNSSPLSGDGQLSTSTMMLDHSFFYAEKGICGHTQTIPSRPVRSGGRYDATELSTMGSPNDSATGAGESTVIEVLVQSDRLSGERLAGTYIAHTRSNTATSNLNSPDTAVPSAMASISRISPRRNIKVKSAAGKTVAPQANALSSLASRRRLTAFDTCSLTDNASAYGSPKSNKSAGSPVGRRIQSLQEGGIPPPLSDATLSELRMSVHSSTLPSPNSVFTPRTVDRNMRARANAMKERAQRRKQEAEEREAALQARHEKAERLRFQIRQFRRRYQRPSPIALQTNRVDELLNDVAEAHFRERENIYIRLVGAPDLDAHPGRDRCLLHDGRRLIQGALRVQRRELRRKQKISRWLEFSLRAEQEGDDSGEETPSCSDIEAWCVDSMAASEESEGEYEELNPFSEAAEQERKRRQILSTPPARAPPALPLESSEKTAKRTEEVLKPSPSLTGSPLVPAVKSPTMATDATSRPHQGFMFEWDTPCGCLSEAVLQTELSRVVNRVVLSHFAMGGRESEEKPPKSAFGRLGTASASRLYSPADGRSGAVGLVELHAALSPKGGGTSPIRLQSARSPTETAGAPRCATPAVSSASSAYNIPLPMRLGRCLAHHTPLHRCIRTATRLVNFVLMRSLPQLLYEGVEDDFALLLGEEEKMLLETILDELQAWYASRTEMKVQVQTLVHAVAVPSVDPHAEAVKPMETPPHLRFQALTDLLQSDRDRIYSLSGGLDDDDEDEDALARGGRVPSAEYSDRAYSGTARPGDSRTGTPSLPNVLPKTEYKPRMGGSLSSESSLMASTSSVVLAKGEKYFGLERCRDARDLSNSSPMDGPTFFGEDTEPVKTRKCWGTVGGCNAKGIQLAVNVCVDMDQVGEPSSRPFLSSPRAAPPLPSPGAAFLPQQSSNKQLRKVVAEAAVVPTYIMSLACRTALHVLLTQRSTATLCRIILSLYRRCAEDQPSISRGGSMKSTSQQGDSGRFGSSFVRLSAGSSGGGPVPLPPLPDGVRAILATYAKRSMRSEAKREELASLSFDAMSTSRSNSGGELLETADRRAIQAYLSECLFLETKPALPPLVEMLFNALIKKDFVLLDAKERPRMISPLLVQSHGGYGLAPFSGECHGFLKSHVEESDKLAKQLERGDVELLTGPVTFLSAVLERLVRPYASLMPLEPLMASLRRCLRQNTAMRYEDVKGYVGSIELRLMIDLVESFAALSDSFSYHRESMARERALSRQKKEVEAAVDIAAQQVREKRARERQTGVLEEEDALRNDHHLDALLEDFMKRCGAGGLMGIHSSAGEGADEFTDLFFEIYRQTLMEWSCVLICETALGYAMDAAGPGLAGFKLCSYESTAMLTENQVDEILASEALDYSFPTVPFSRLNPQVAYSAVEKNRSVVLETLVRLKGELYFFLTGLDERGHLLEIHRRLLQVCKAGSLRRQKNRVVQSKKIPLDGHRLLRHTIHNTTSSSIAPRDSEPGSSCGGLPLSRCATLAPGSASGRSGRMGACSGDSSSEYAQMPPDSHPYPPSDTAPSVSSSAAPRFRPVGGNLIPGVHPETLAAMHAATEEVTQGISCSPLRLVLLSLPMRGNVENAVSDSLRGRVGDGMETSAVLSSACISVLGGGEEGRGGLDHPHARGRAAHRRSARGSQSAEVEKRASRFSTSSGQIASRHREELRAIDSISIPDKDGSSTSHTSILHVPLENTQTFQPFQDGNEPVAHAPISHRPQRIAVRPQAVSRPGSRHDSIASSSNCTASPPQPLPLGRGSSAYTSVHGVLRALTQHLQLMEDNRAAQNRTNVLITGEFYEEGCPWSNSRAAEGQEAVREAMNAAALVQQSLAKMRMSEAYHSSAGGFSKSQPAGSRSNSVNGGLRRRDGGGGVKVGMLPSASSATEVPPPSQEEGAGGKVSIIGVEPSGMDQTDVKEYFMFHPHLQFDASGAAIAPKMRGVESGSLGFKSVKDEIKADETSVWDFEKTVEVPERDAPGTLTKAMERRRAKLPVVKGIVPAAIVRRYGGEDLDALYEAGEASELSSTNGGGSSPRATSVATSRDGKEAHTAVDDVEEEESVLEVYIRGDLACERDVEQRASSAGKGKATVPAAAKKKGAVTSIDAKLAVPFSSTPSAVAGGDSSKKRSVNDTGEPLKTPQQRKRGKEEGKGSEKQPWYAHGSPGFLRHRLVSKLKRSKPNDRFDLHTVSPLIALQRCVDSHDVDPLPLGEEECASRSNSRASSFQGGMSATISTITLARSPVVATDMETTRAFSTLNGEGPSSPTPPPAAFNVNLFRKSNPFISTTPLHASEVKRTLKSLVRKKEMALEKERKDAIAHETHGNRPSVHLQAKKEQLKLPMTTKNMLYPAPRSLSLRQRGLRLRKETLPWSKRSEKQPLHGDIYKTK